MLLVVAFILGAVVFGAGAIACYKMMKDYADEGEIRFREERDD